MGRKVKNTNKKKPRISNPIPSNKSSVSTIYPKETSDLLFDFKMNEWLKSVKIDDFTNKLKNENIFAENITHVLTELFPIIQQNWNDIVGRKGQFKNSHPIANEKIELVTKILHEIYGDNLFSQDGLDNNLWQLGISGSVRVICYLDTSRNNMIPLFIDHHHLIHDSVKYNHHDYSKFSYCPYCKYNYGNVEGYQYCPYCKYSSKVYVSN